MSVCPHCQRPLDAQSLDQGRCAACSHPLHNVPQRTLRDLRDVTLGNFDAAAVEQSAGQDAEGAHPAQSGPPPQDDPLKTVELPAPAPTSSPTASAARTAGSETVDNIPTSSDQEQADASDPPAPASRRAVKNPAKATVAGVDAESSGPLKTVAFESDRTVDFGTIDMGESSGISADDLVLMTSQWEGQEGADSGATIRQKETLIGGGSGTSSLSVKSRQVRTASTEPTFIASSADAPDYELLNVIGEGGMGVVYAARQSSIARTVALKMLKGGAGTAEQRDKFISEAVVTGELDHPNIVPIYDLGSNDDGALFYSMKRVKGTPWCDVIQERGLEENLNIFLRVCDAVAFAHVNGVIHRDLKPENVMLGDYGEVLVMDWGLARISPNFPNAASVSQ
ncbi:MAG: protein kinase, partial [Planctomycetales bacterium]|nr:protein kinase [Planctomycetales bacterium]